MNYRSRLSGVRKPKKYFIDCKAGRTDRILHQLYSDLVAAVFRIAHHCFLIPFSVPDCPPNEFFENTGKPTCLGPARSFSDATDPKLPAHQFSNVFAGVDRDTLWQTSCLLAHFFTIRAMVCFAYAASSAKALWPLRRPSVQSANRPV